MGHPRIIHYATAIALGCCFDVAPPALAATDTNSGNQLYEWCTDTSNLFNQGVCDGTILGTVNGMTMTVQMYERVPVVCLRDTITNGQVVEVVTAYLRNHPADRDRPATGLIFLALHEAYPCPAQK